MSVKLSILDVQCPEVEGCGYGIFGRGAAVLLVSTSFEYSRFDSSQCFAKL